MPARLRVGTSSIARGSGRRVAGLAVTVVLLAVAMLLSVAIGARSIPLGETIGLIFTPDGSSASTIIWQSRVPRTLVGLVAGAALGVCGALIQGFTRNPLADPGILGVNAGAGFAVTLAVGGLGVSAASGYVWFAFAGALAATVIVYAIGATGAGAAKPEKLTLAGVAVAAVLGGITTAIQLKNFNTFQGSLRWSVGSLGGRAPDTVALLAIFVVVGLVLALFIARQLNALALGDDLGRSLGVRIGRTRVLAVVAVTLLAGSATALAGPIAFVGLMVPHAVRWFTGPDQRWIVTYSAVAAGILLLASDIVARVALPDGELPVGFITAFLGAPVLIALVRRSKASTL